MGAGLGATFHWSVKLHLTKRVAEPVERPEP